MGIGLSIRQSCFFAFLGHCFSGERTSKTDIKNIAFRRILWYDKSIKPSEVEQ